MEKKKLWIAAFDIGKLNFAFAVQEFDNDIIEVIKNNKNNGKKYCERLDFIFGAGKLQLLEKLDLTKGCEKVYLDPKTFFNMTSVLDRFSEIWEKCDVILIEQQMHFKKKRNTMALKLGQHCFSYFCIKHPTKQIIEFPSYHKTQVLQAPKKFGKIKKTFKNGKTIMINDTLKKWSARMCAKILSILDDDEYTKKFNNFKKKDDVSDCVLMIQAYIFLESEK